MLPVSNGLQLIPLIHNIKEGLRYTFDKIRLNEDPTTPEKVSGLIVQLKSFSEIDEGVKTKLLELATLLNMNEFAGSDLKATVEKIKINVKVPSTHKAAGTNSAAPSPAPTAPAPAAKKAQNQVEEMKAEFPNPAPRVPASVAVPINKKIYPVEELLKKINQWVAEAQGNVDPAIRDLVQRRILDFINNNTQTKLDLSSISIDGLPDIFDHPIFVECLIELDISHNKLTSFPPSIGQLRNLEIFNAGKNKISVVSMDLCRLSKLRVLRLQENQISDFPLHLCLLRSLTGLNLSDNKIQAVPAQIVYLVHLEFLDLDSNDLKQVPPFKQMKRLRYLYLRMNDRMPMPMPPSGNSVILLSKPKGTSTYCRICIDGYAFNDAWNEYAYFVQPSVPGNNFFSKLPGRSLHKVFSFMSSEDHPQVKDEVHFMTTAHGYTRLLGEYNDAKDMATVMKQLGENNADQLQKFINDPVKFNLYKKAKDRIKQGDLESATVYFKALLEDPNLPAFVIHGAADLQDKLNNKEEAIRLNMLAINAAGANAPVRILVEVGVKQLKRGNFEDALGLFQRVKDAGGAAILLNKFKMKPVTSLKNGPLKDLPMSIINMIRIMRALGFTVEADKVLANFIEAARPEGEPDVPFAPVIPITSLKSSEKSVEIKLPEPAATENPGAASNDNGLVHPEGKSDQKTIDKPPAEPQQNTEPDVDDASLDIISESEKSPLELELEGFAASKTFSNQIFTFAEDGMEQGMRVICNPEMKRILFPPGKKEGFAYSTHGKYVIAYDKPLPQKMARMVKRVFHTKEIPAQGIRLGNPITIFCGQVNDMMSVAYTADPQLTEANGHRTQVVSNR